ncbi:MAG TPA: trypsin-like peptidase domain-containing protein, partial [Aquaticitalea sp.]|nr:trypsin-like peptidase domain-containing protein [Aquaticitalea sp.]
MNFSNSIKTINTFVRPIRTVIKNFGNSDPIPGSGTMFFVNDNGVAVTCKHISNILRNVAVVNQNWDKYLAEKSKLKRRSDQKGLAKQFGFNNDSTIQILYTVVNSFDTFTAMTIHEHPQLDLAIIEFKGFNSINYTGHAEFPSHNTFVEQGEFFCRLGFPFPEFTNFQFNQSTEKLEWTSSGNLLSPIFPIEGMVTRKINDSNGIEIAIEFSRPGLRGQSGGPLFDAEGLIFG